MQLRAEPRELPRTSARDYWEQLGFVCMLTRGEKEQKKGKGKAHVNTTALTITQLIYYGLCSACRHPHCCAVRRAKFVFIIIIIPISTLSHLGGGLLSETRAKASHREDLVGHPKAELDQR